MIRNVTNVHLCVLSTDETLVVDGTRVPGKINCQLCRSSLLHVVCVEIKSIRVHTARFLSLKGLFGSSGT